MRMRLDDSFDRRARLGAAAEGIASAMFHEMRVSGMVEGSRQCEVASVAIIARAAIVACQKVVNPPYPEKFR